MKNIVKFSVAIIALAWLYSSRMKNIARFLLALTVILCLYSSTSFAQDTLRTRKKLGWYVTPEVSAMFLNNHVGRAVGIQMGVKLLKGHLKVGYYMYGRSGPINDQTFDAPLPDGVTYKGKSSLKLRADHASFGLMIAPTFKLPNTRITIDVPIYVGSIGAGFYLAGDDRKTPDGRKVSEWEDELFDGKDAAFAGTTEFGLRAFIPTKNEHVSWGAGIHYTMVSDWKTFIDPKGELYNNRLRASVFVNFGSK